MHRVRHRQGKRYDESLHRIVATKSGSILPATSGQNARLSTGFAMRSLATLYGPKSPVTTSDKCSDEGFETTSNYGNRFTTSSPPIQKDSNPHSITDHQTPITRSRGFLHHVLSDACPITFSRRLRGSDCGQASNNP